MKEKLRMAAERISAPFKKIGNIVKKPFEAFYEKHQTGIGKTVVVLNKYSLVFHALWAMLLELMIESFVVKGFLFMTGSPLVFLYNALLIFMTLMIVYLVRRRFVLRLTISAIWLYGGYMNGTVLSNRVTPFTAQDIKLLEDLADILDKYMSPVLEKRTKISGEDQLCKEYRRDCSSDCSFCRLYSTRFRTQSALLLFWKYCLCL